MNLNERQKQVLCHLIESHIEKAEPVGSKTLVDDFDLPFSSATIRNDLALLEKMGFLEQPHTSAGRIPTRMAYAYYLEKVICPKANVLDERRLERAIQAAEDQERAIKALAKGLVELTGEMAIVAFKPNWSYYTGVSNLFAKPEFADALSISQLIDRFDEVLDEIFPQVSGEPMVMIGEQNPFGKNMTTIIVQYHLEELAPGAIGIVGPIRMDYEKNLGIVLAAAKVLEEV